MANVATLTGSKELGDALKQLSEKAADRIAKGVVGAGLTVMARAMRKVAPVGPTGNAKKAIGKRLVKVKKTGAITGKAGINVGKNIVKKGRFAPHAHLVALGTKPRTRKRIGGQFASITNPTSDQLSTGVMPSNPFIRTAASSSASSAMARMKKEAEKRLAAEAKRAKKR